MKTALTLLADGFEEIEAVTPVDLLRRAGAEVTLASCGESLQVTGKCGMTLQADALLADCLESALAEPPHLLVLPGGPAVFDLRKDLRVLDLVRARAEADLPTAAICAAPLLLLDAGALEGKTHTAHHTCAEELPALRPDLPVASDGALVTSRGAGTALAFGLRLVALLFGPEKAEEIALSIHA